MTLTVCVGSSGSGKTTFLEHVHKSHKCTYIRQFHMMRPYITVKSIPNFDPTQLPFWDIYVKEGTADKIQVGGYMAGKITAGFSGGQRKLLLFELIFQRTKDQKDLLIALDEPFSGVTDDFVPFITERLQKLSDRHNILLVTNDHVDALKSMADNIITVSAIDRSVVKINDNERVDREMAILALSIGDKYVYESSQADYKFFFDVEVINRAVLEIAIFATFTFTLFIATFWNSNPESAPLVLIAGSMISFFSINPYLLAIVEWRNNMLEEAEALVHASKTANRNMKLLLTLSIIFCLSLVQFLVINLAVKSKFKAFKFWIAMLFDTCSLVLPLVTIGLYTRLPFQLAQILGSSPFLLMIFLSTTFSPGAGVPVLKDLRYLFARYYLWCMVPGVQDMMEGCPPEHYNMLYLILSAFLGVTIVFVILRLGKFKRTKRHRKEQHKRDSLLFDRDFQELQVSMYGQKALRRFKHGHTENGSDSESIKFEAGHTAPTDNIHKDKGNNKNNNNSSADNSAEVSFDDNVAAQAEMAAEVTAIAEAAAFVDVKV